MVGFQKSIQKQQYFDEEQKKLIKNIQAALKDVKTLSGLLPICSNCKKIRDDKGYWNQIERYIQEYSEAKFSHGICPDCCEELYGKEDWYLKIREKRAQKE